jgi:hypothetical protein
MLHLTEVVECGEDQALHGEIAAVEFQ